MKQSLGMVEVVGITTATAAIDAMCKNAFVKVAAIEQSGAGWLTIIIEGDLASVQAALEVGADAASYHGQVIAVKSIPRPDPGLYDTLVKGAGENS
ncbi:BMC domain-containing protein [Gracilibacillus alcaliphilus]|uniref:BMC domain-containing protein n=1 Tax=Gracilibacillus alcaliphilus TaxID=1401441 RepID=UPI0019572570|nr:BMC domain-containing protein [Gracilibacillus alcaliphilus]MBM7677019.1 microcompartment protein CcmL/EutN [Gracilibacillus alcaliphilus]